MLHAGVAPPGADRFIKLVVAADIAEQLAISRPETMDRRFVEQHLADRLQFEAVDRAGRALGQRIERAQRFDLVAKEIEPHRLRRARRVEIDDAAADRELARLAHRVGAGVTVVAEEALQPVEADFPAGTDRQHPPIEQLTRRHALHHRVDRRQHEKRSRFRPAREPSPKGGQRIDAPAGYLAVRRHPVVGQAVPGREGQHTEPGMEELQLGGKARHASIVAADMQPGTELAVAQQAAERRRVVPFRRAEQRRAPRQAAEKLAQIVERHQVDRGV